MIDHPALVRLRDAMRANPTITSVGPPPERHAERVVDEMIAWLHRAATSICAGPATEMNLARLGGVRAQTRFFEALKKNMGPLMLTYDFEPRKRGKFILIMTLWAIWDQTRNAPVTPGDPLPPGSGLAAAVYSLEGKGYYRDWRVWPMFGLSRHACMRLAQRAEVRTVNDLIHAMRLVWSAAVPLFEPGKALPEKPVLLPLRDGPDSPVIVFERHRERDSMLVVKTILAHGMASALDLTASPQDAKTDTDPGASQ